MEDRSSRASSFYLCGYWMEGNATQAKARHISQPIRRPPPTKTPAPTGGGVSIANRLNEDRLQKIFGAHLGCWYVIFGGKKKPVASSFNRVTGLYELKPNLCGLRDFLLRIPGCSRFSEAMQRVLYPDWSRPNPVRLPKPEKSASHEERH